MNYVGYINILVGVLILLPTTVFSNDQGILNDSEVKQALVDAAFPELSDNEFNSGGSAAYIHTGTDKETAYLRFGDIITGKERNQEWSVAIETPFDEEQDRVILGDFDGLTDTTNVTISYSRRKISDSEEDISEYVYSRTSALCKQALEPEYERIVNELKGREELTPGDKTDLRHAFRRINQENDGCGKDDFRWVYKKNGCNLVESKETCEELADKKFDEFYEKRKQLLIQFLRDGHINPYRASFTGAKLTLGRKTYKFNNADTLGKENSQETPWSFSLYKDWIKGYTAYGFGIEYQKSFVEQSETEICRPFDGFSGALSCDTLRIGAPDEQKREIVFIKLSHYAPTKGFAIQPKISYDFVEGEAAVDLPIYMMRDKKGLLTGGLRIGWNSEDDEIVAGIFIGQAFEFSGLY